MKTFIESCEFARNVRRMSDDKVRFTDDVFDWEIDVWRYKDFYVLSIPSVFRAHFYSPNVRDAVCVNLGYYCVWDSGSLDYWVMRHKLSRIDFNPNNVQRLRPPLYYGDWVS